MSREQSASENKQWQDGRDFNNRGGERGRQPISFRSCEHTDQKAAQVASAPPGPLSRCEDEARSDQQKDRTQMRMVQWQDDPASQRREEVGKLQEDRSKAVIAKATSEEASAGTQGCIAEVRRGSDGTSSS